MVCVNRWFVWRDVIPSHKPFIILCITSLHTNHLFTQTLYSHKLDNHTNQINPFMQTIPSHKPIIILCITYNLVCVKGWFVWHPYTQTINHSQYYISSHKPSLQTNHPFTQTIYHFLYYILSGFVWLSGLWINGLCHYLACVDGLCKGM